LVAAENAMTVCGSSDRMWAMVEESADGAVPERWTASAAYTDDWMDPADDPRESATELTDERSVLVEYIRAYRLTMELKCADLDADQLACRSVPPSTMSLLGLIRHMTDVERHWFRRVMAGEDAPPLYWTDGEADVEWTGAIGDPEVVAQAWDAWRGEVGYAERYVNGSGDLGNRGTMRDGKTISLREVLVHMIDEYARHCGHADLLRERIDGRIGQ
jgi:uncharacterized damage-inducible protein DinB